ncbi:MAG TPA: NAD(P)/FAD-dependent oxidoreductase [Coxiellaceae bacterium]|nr:NAD(P)/FAD-dependent oxidoreductase [Coxiellaceae bacterium]
MQKVEVIIIGAGAAGLMCAIEAGKRGRQVLVLDHANKAGKKILMSGGGRCNFTNLNINPDNYLSHNPHFCKSALKRYTQWNFIELVKKHAIPFHEKTLGQLFCDNKSKDILDMLLLECQLASANILLETHVEKIEQLATKHFRLKTNRGDFQCESLVIASGGLSIPTMGASPFGYKVAEQFNIKVWPTRAGLVPFTLQPADKDKLAILSGIAVNSLVTNHKTSFREQILFTHRGLSGPAILQISSYWQPGEAISINLIPEKDLGEELKNHKIKQAQKLIKTIMTDYLAKRVVENFLDPKVAETKLAELSQQQLTHIAEQFHRWTLKPNGTEGYRTAEVTLGGIDCNALSSKSFEANEVPGLYFIGEVVDVSGWLGGFNFQWAWSSGWAAGQVV